MVAESATLNGLMPPSEHNSRLYAITYDVTFRYSPRPSKSLAVLLWGLAFRSAVSVRGMGATPSLWTHLPLMKWEFPRLCRGGTRSLTDPGVHPRNSWREPRSTRKGETGWTSMKA